MWRMLGPSLSPIIGSSGTAIFLKFLTPAGVLGFFLLAWSGHLATSSVFTSIALLRRTSWIGNPGCYGQ